MNAVTGLEFCLWNETFAQVEGDSVCSFAQNMTRLSRHSDSCLK